MFLFFLDLLRKRLIGASISSSFSSFCGTFNVKLWWLLIFVGERGCCSKGGSIARTSKWVKLTYSFSFFNYYKYLINQYNITCIFLTWKCHIMYNKILIHHHLNILNTSNMLHSFTMVFNMHWNIKKKVTCQIIIEEVKFYS